MWFRGTKPPRPKPRPAARCNGPPELTSAFRRARGRIAASRARRKSGAFGGLMTQLLLFNVTNGLIIGAFYVLMALGLSLILNLSNVINFAHGGFLVVGGYIAYTITPYLGFWGALLVAPPLTAVVRPGT